ncbi:MAG: OmpA family protein [Polyangiaceae bacterium]
MLEFVRKLLVPGSKVARAAVAFGVAAAALLTSRPSPAQTRTWYLDRAQISGAPDDGFMVWRPNMSERSRFYGMMALGYTLNPLHDSAVTDDGTTQERIQHPVKGQIIDYLSVGMELASRVSFNVALPIALYQVTGEDPSGRGVSSDGLNVKKTTIHDLRVDARVKAHESNNHKFRLGFGGALFAPTGDSNSFTGDDKTTGWIFGNVEYDAKKFLIAGQIGPHFRPDRSIGGPNGDLYLASELRYAAGVYFPLRSGKVRLGGEVFGSTGLFTKAGGPDSTFFKGKNTNLEWLAQARFGLGEKQKTWLMAGAGTRASTGYGSPDLRVLVSLGHYLYLSDVEPKSPPRKVRVRPDVEDYAADRDKDGYPDDIDKCPDEPEDGKPPEPSDGCPAGADRDNDGIPDSADACPDNPEDKDGVADTDGCPEDDADNDQIPDKDDHCPLEPGLKNKIAEKNGCPGLTKVTEDGEVALLEPIQFETGKAVIKPVSYPILDEVVALMKARGKLRIGVYGHTDDVGADAMNMKLSKDRAASCMKYLTTHGIESSRLESEGFGETKPLVPNDSKENRAKNRRVEFKILGGE